MQALALKLSPLWMAVTACYILTQDLTPNQILFAAHGSIIALTLLVIVGPCVVSDARLASWGRKITKTLAKFSTIKRPGK